MSENSVGKRHFRVLLFSRDAELSRRGSLESALDSNPGVNSAFADLLVFMRI